MMINNRKIKQLSLLNSSLCLDVFLQKVCGAFFVWNRVVIFHEAALLCLPFAVVFMGFGQTHKNGLRGLFIS